MPQQCLEYCLRITTNQRFFSRVVHTTTYQWLFTIRGPPYPKKAEILKEFLGILESFWRILDISKRILELFSGKFRDELRHI